MTNRPSRPRWLTLLAFCSAGVFAAGTSAETAAGQELPVDTSVTVGTLANGVRYYIRANTKPENRAELRLVVNAGSVLEDDDQRGLAHFIEHMAFNGTRNFPKQALVNFLERTGMRFGAHVNAYTSFDETVYTLTVPTDSLATLRGAFQILEDWAHYVTFDSTEVEKERGVVIEEWRRGRGAGMRMFMHNAPTILASSRYADRLPIGDRATLESFDHAALKRFYRDWYRPELMAVVAVGDFDTPQIEEWIKEHFGRIASGAAPRPRTAVVVPDQPGTLVTIAADPEATGSTVEVLHKQDVIARGSEAVERQLLIEHLHNTILNRRFGEMVQRPGAPFIRATAGTGSLVRTKQAYTLTAVTAEGHIETALQALLTEAERIARHGVTAGELDRAKADILRGYERAYAERDRTESRDYADEYVRAYLGSEPIPGIGYEYDFANRIVPGISVDEVNRFARESVKEANRVIVVNAPQKEGMLVPTEEQLLAVISRVAANSVAAYIDLATDEPLLASIPPPGSVVAENAIPELGVTEWKLGNGVRVLLKPTDYRADEVLLTGFSPGGTSLAPDSIHTSAQFATTIASLGGVGSFSAVDLQKKLAGRSVSVMPTLGTFEEGFSAQASVADLEILFQLVYLYATAPRRDSSVVLSYQERLKASIANRGANPEAVFADTVGVTMAQGHFRRRPPTVELLDELRLDSALRFYRERFADASDFTFVVVGAFNPDSIRPLVQSYLGSLPALNRGESWRDEGIRAPGGIVRKIVRRGVEPKASTRIAFTGPFEFNRANLLALGVLGDVLELRLRERLREELGGTYSVGAGGSATNRPGTTYAFSISFGSAPERAEELTAAVFAEIEALRNNGPTADEMAKVKEMRRREYETNLQRNEYWIATLSSSLSSGLDPRDVLTFPTFIQSITPELVQQAARSYLNTDNYAQFTLLPEGAP
ncbi:MAG: insulinase family protein [Gemmatimonadaceae bacterium]|nr:insulinase family protein [Gemmatimonadaceae bacterium]